MPIPEDMPESGDRFELPVPARLLVLLLLLAVLAGLVWAVLSLRLPAPGLTGAVADHLDQSGVDHPVTAVLLNFRAYDTLLELVVLLLALLGVRSFDALRGCAGAEPGPLLNELWRLLVPLMVVVAGYLIWVGKHAPGGAFQAGAVLAGAGILLCLSRVPLLAVVPDMLLRALAVLGVGLFAGLGVLVTLLGEPFLGWPDAVAGTLILGIELAAMLSIGVILTLLFIGGRP
jgi:multisubunit Na+/H+ antiporter MnhB subunit